MQKEFLIAVVDKKLGKPSYDKIHGAPWNNHDSLESAFKLIYEWIILSSVTYRITKKGEDSKDWSIDKGNIYSLTESQLTA